jgi:hypothetical protein
MRPIWAHRRMLFFALAVCVVLAVSAIGIAGNRQTRHGSAARPTADPPVHPRSDQHVSLPPVQLTPAMAPTVAAPQTPIQQQIDTQLARAETPEAIAAARATTVPAPRVSTSYPAVPSVDRRDATAYAIAFATELLDLDYAHQTRAGLLAWAEHEEAPNTLPGVPTDVAGKSLVLSLADPGLPGASPSPVPAPGQWVANGVAGVLQHVSHVQAEVAPDWTQLISEGWEPADPLMTIETVTGTLTTTAKAKPAQSRSFSLTVTLGSAAYAPGYGAVAAADWNVG